MARAEQEKPQKTYIRMRFGGSEDPAATDPVYFSHNNIPYLVPRETEFVIAREAVAHLFEKEYRIVSKQDPMTGKQHQFKRAVSFNVPQVLEVLTEEQALPIIAEQKIRQAEQRAKQDEKNNEIMQS